MEGMEFKMRLRLRCIHHFESDLINNIDCKRILGTELSSVILRQCALSRSGILLFRQERVHVPLPRKRLHSHFRDNLSLYNGYVYLSM